MQLKTYDSDARVRSRRSVFSFFLAATMASLILKSPYPDVHIPNQSITDYLFERFEQLGPQTALIDALTGLFVIKMLMNCIDSLELNRKSSDFCSVDQVVGAACFWSHQIGTFI